MFLDYFALGMLFFVAIVLFYGIIAIHDIPYEIAKKRNHYRRGDGQTVDKRRIRDGRCSCFGDREVGGV
jgi:hypothetical protein